MSITEQEKVELQREGYVRACMDKVVASSEHARAQAEAFARAAYPDPVTYGPTTPITAKTVADKLRELATLARMEHPALAAYADAEADRLDPPAPMGKMPDETKRQPAFTDPVPVVVTASPTADTRTCDVATVTEAELGRSSRLHIEDVRAGLLACAAELLRRSEAHDADKLTDLAWFHRDFRTKFADTGWWDRHRCIWRHHLGQPDGVPDDVNLIDVLEYVVDCVVAGMARSGSVYPLVIDDDVLRRAFVNTQAQLTALVRRQEDDHV